MHARAHTQAKQNPISSPCPIQLCSKPSLYLHFLAPVPFNSVPNHHCTFIFQPLSHSTLFQTITVPSFSSPCPIQLCSKPSLYLHFPAPVPFNSVPNHHCTFIFQPLSHSTLFQTITVPSFSSPCPIQLCSKPSPYLHFPAPVPFNSVPNHHCTFIF